MKKKVKGTALAYALIMIAVVSILLTSVMQFVVTRLQVGYYSESKQQAFEVAEAGVFWYRWYLAHQTDGKTAQQIAAFWQTGNPLGVGNAYEMEYDDPWTGNAIGKFSVSVQTPVAGSTVATITVKGWTYKYPDNKRELQVRFRRPSWSEYSVLGNAYQRFGSGTTVNGKLFVNGGIHFDGVATNTVSSSVASYFDSDSDVNATKPGVWTSWSGEYNTTMHSNVFAAGKSFPVPVKDFSSVTSNLGYMKTQAQAGGTTGKYFDNSGVGQQITLKTDGTFDACTVNAYDAFASGSGTNEVTNYTAFVNGATGTYSGTNGNSCGTITACCAYATCTSWVQSSNHAKGKCVSLSNYAIPDNGVIFVEDNVWLDGSINNKKVTIAAANFSGSASVFIKNNLTYTHFDGNDVIGIVAEKDIEITENSSDNLTIDGALLAVNGRVGRQQYNSFKSTISVFGAIATNQRYGFSYTGSNIHNCGGGLWIADGYCVRNLTYDNNLLYYPPPYFPTGSQYLMDLWQEK